MAEPELRWSDLQEEAKKPLNELLTNIRNDVTRDIHEYPEDIWDREQFEIRQFERADGWVRSAFQVYRDALGRLGHDLPANQAIIWSNGISAFIDHRVRSLLEEAFGVTDKDREFLRIGEIAVKRLNRIRAGHSLEGTTPWLKVEAARQTSQKLRKQWKAKLCDPKVEEATGEPMIGSQVPSACPEPYLERIQHDLNREMQRTNDMLWELQGAQREEDRKKTELHCRDLERARQLEHARELAKIKQADQTQHPEASQSGIIPPNEEPIFTHTPDYRSIRFNGQAHGLTFSQATIIKILHKAFERGTPYVGKAELLAAVESETSRVQDFFRGSPLWKTLVVSTRRGTYGLNLSH